MSGIASIFDTMRFAARTRFHLTAGLLTLALIVSGSAFGSTHQSAHRTAGRRSTHGSHFVGNPGAKRHGHTTPRHTSNGHGRHHRASSRHHQANLGQRAMDSQRAMEIQQALVQAHYLNGTPTGQWDTETQAAMQKYQTDNGWQSKITPDSRAIIKLGLGPKQDEGEYPADSTSVLGSSGVSKLSDATPADPIRTMATSEMPATTQN